MVLRQVGLVAVPATVMTERMGRTQGWYRSPSRRQRMRVTG